MKVIRDGGRYAGRVALSMVAAVVLSACDNRSSSVVGAPVDTTLPDATAAATPTAASSQDGPAASDADFGAHAVAIYTGASTPPDFSGAQQEYSDFQTRIDDAVAGGVNFGGHFALVEIGCGSGCRLGFIADLQSGTITDIPVGGEEFPYLTMAYRPGSSLLKASWEQVDENFENKMCVREAFVWNGVQFSSSGQTKEPGECVS